MIDVINNICNINAGNLINLINWDNYSVDSNDLHTINYILLVFTAMFVYCGYAESQANYNNLCSITIGKITDILLEENRDSSLLSITYGIKNYANKELYRIKVNYKYKINNIEKTGYFYNNTKHAKYEELDKIKKYWNNHKSNPYLKIYYLKSNNAISNVNILNIKHNNINFYYRCGLVIFILLILLIITLIFSIFCIIT